MSKHTPKKLALSQAGKRAVSGRKANRSVKKAAKRLNRLTEESHPGFKRKK